MAKIRDRFGPRQQRREALALLKILALGDQEVEAGKISPVAKVFAQLRAKQAAENPEKSC